MFKLVVFLCAGLFLTLLIVLGRDGGPVRDGLAGKMPPLMHAGRARGDACHAHRRSQTPRRKPRRGPPSTPVDTRRLSPRPPAARPRVPP